MLKSLPNIPFSLDVLPNDIAKYNLLEDISLAHHSELKRSSPEMSNSSKNIFKTGYVLNDKWVIIEFVGKGAMGEVYRAHQLNLKRDVAIKVISREMLASLEDDSKEIETAIQRYRREVQAMARVRHAKVFQICD